MDLAVSPAEDFYQYANGGWLARTEIPSDSAAYTSFHEVIDKTEEQQLAQLDALIAGNTLEEGSDQWKAVEFFKQGTDMETRNALGIAPVQPQLDLIAGITDLADLHEKLASPEFYGLPNFFNAGLTPDLADSSVNTAWLAGPPLGLPDVTYYTEDSESNIAAREAYKATAAEFFQALGMSEADAAAAAQEVYDLEAAFAAQMLTPIEYQDANNYNHPTTLDEMQALYPDLDWQAYMTSAGATVDGSSTVINAEQRLMENLATIVGTADLETIKNYLTLHMIFSAADFLDQPMRDISFGYEQALYGVPEQNELEQDVLGTVNGMMPEAMGQVYVSEFFPPEAKAEIEALVENLIAAFRIRLENNTWMTEETKTAALEKLEAMRVKVGYPDTWQTYENYTIGDSYWSTAFDSWVADNREQMAKYGQPVDVGEWWMSPQTVNAGYDPSKNDITFPAAILQPPFYDPGADPASNYGAIGYAIGHEITHAFDLQGSQFDKDGNFVDWWTDEDRAAFEALNAEVVAQYDAVEVLPELFVNGQLTVTENVADMGAVQAAYDALQIALAEDGDPGEIDGLTQAQRFFIAAAQVWREKVRTEAMEAGIQSNVHAPGIARATLPAANTDAFYEAFDIPPTSPEYIAPDDRVVIW
jgi:predicted metalloendopeptidase